MLKDIDSAARAEFLKLFFWIFCPVSIIGFLIDGIMGVLAGGVLSLFSSFVWMGFIDNASGAGAGILTGRILKGGGLSLREQLEPEMQKARYFKGQKQFDQALETVDGILEKDTAHAEALYLKAGILWEGFGDAAAAKECLRRIMELDPVENETFRRWAAGFYQELSGIAVSDQSAQHDLDRL